MAGQFYNGASDGFGQLGSYGSPEKAKAGYENPFERTRRRVNVVSVFFCLLLPCVIFMTVFGLLSFNMHFERPGLCWFIVVVALLVVVFCGGCALLAVRQKKAGDSSREPTWLIFLAISCLVAWSLAFILGEWNYRSTMLPHYNVVTLNSYTNVDVGEISGAGVMDAGRLTFKAGSYIDTSKAIAFKQTDTYCAAPIASGKVPLVTYDFWATGVNCCSGEPGDFHCGEVDGKLQLGGGARVLNDADLPWFTLATQQAQAFYHINVGHAIFFKNVADPLSEESAQTNSGVKFFCLWSFLFFGIQLFMVAVTLVVFSRTIS